MILFGLLYGFSKQQEIIVGNDWTSNLQSNWDTMIDGIMQYDLDNVYFGLNQQYPKMQNDTGSFVNSFYFCTQ